jgi:ABC-type sugar transport system ATPase subunit
MQVLALRGLDLEISAGEVVVLLGPSGSGKSTLLNIMGGLDHATSGQLFFRDLDLTNLDDRGLTAYRRQHVGFVFQFYNLIPSLTAYENVALVTEISAEGELVIPTMTIRLLPIKNPYDVPPQAPAKDRFSRADMEETSGSGRVEVSQREGLNPLNVTVTSQRTAALDGRLLKKTDPSATVDRVRAPWA